MNIKKIVLITGISTVMLAATSMALADNGATGQMPALSAENAQKMVLEVKPNGNVLLRGTVVTTATGTVTVKSFGGNWTVNILPTSQLMPGTGMTTGDFVGVQGKINTSTDWTIDATLVRDWSVRQQTVENRQEIKAAEARNWEGVASNVNATANTLTLTVDGTAYNVVLTANVKVVNKSFAALPFASIQNGDTVRVYGAASSGTITASVLRDVSSGMATGR